MAIIRENDGDAGADSSTRYTLSLGDVFQGALDPANDKDWVRVELTAGTIYDITLTGVDSAQLQLLDSEGNHVVSGDTGDSLPSGSKLIFNPAVTGTYFVHAGSGDSSISGDYEISIIENTIPTGTYDEIADYLTDGFWEWGGGPGFAFDVAPGGVLTADITALTEAGKQLARWALEAWTNVTGIIFKFVADDNAHITFDDNEDGGSGGPTSTVSDGIIVSSHVNVSADYNIKFGTTIDSYTFFVYVHEIGHALGLGHSGPYSGIDIVYGVDNIFLNDTWQVSLMSYFGKINNASFASPVTPMIADIIAIQNLYGVPDNINIGDTIYGYQSNLDGYLGEFFKLWTIDKNPFSSIVLGDGADTPYSKPRLADLDSDGDPDLVVGNNSGSLYYFENSGTPTNPNFTERTGTANPLNGVSVDYHSTPTFADLDNDGDQDLIVGNGDGAIAYFENTGTATAPGFTQRTGAANPFDTITKGAFSTVALADLDDDGDLDLAVGNNDGDVHYYENTGTSANPDFTSRTGETSPLNNISAGSYSTPVFADFDNDNDNDLVVGNSSGDIFYFENTGTTTEPSFIQRTDFDNPFNGFNAGAFIAPAFVDLNGDGNLDLIVGNQVGGIFYFKNIGTDANPEFSPQSLTGPTALTIYDNGGNDTLDLRTDTNDQRVYLRPEGISDVYGLTGNLSIARDTVIENFIAGSGNDLIAGNAAANYLNGRDGDDRLWGSGGDDILEGGAGADTLDGGEGSDTASYTDSDAAITVNLADGTITGGHAEGDTFTSIENLAGSAHADTLTGDSGNNILEGGPGADLLDGAAGNDAAAYTHSNTAVTVNLASGTATGGHATGDSLNNIESLLGSRYNDTLIGDAGTNRLDGGPGHDRLTGRQGADTLIGGLGNDTADYAGSPVAVTVRLHNLSASGGDAQGDTFPSLLDVAYTDADGHEQTDSLPDVENLIGSAHDDILAGDRRDNVLDGGFGDDILYGGPGGGDDVLMGGGGTDALFGGIGNDILDGGANADTLQGGAGADTASFEHSDAAVTVHLADGLARGGHAEGDVITDIENITGSNYDDVLTGDDGANVLEGGAGADQLDGGAGIDWLSYAGSDGAVSVRLYDGYAGRGHAEGDVISGFENLRGSAYADILSGTGMANRLEGGAGDDSVWGGSGDDVLEGGAGADKLYGGTGIDTASYRSSDTGVTVNLKEGSSEGGHAGGDVFTDIENIAGSVYRDVLVGDDGVNRLDGNEGDDELKGGIGNDQLFGNVGDDWLYGGNGDDELRGNEGNDRLFGEIGDDSLYGDAGEDQLHGGNDNDQLFGGIEDDTLYGGAGDDELHGGEGNDQLFGNAGADQVDGGIGIDWMSYKESDAGVTVNLTDSTGAGGDAQGDVITNVENLIGSGYADVLTGDGGANTLRGLDGDDELRGNGGNDVLEGGAGADQLDGGPGVDQVSYRDSDEGITVNLAEGTSEGGHAEGDILTGIENVMGSDYADVITGDNAVNQLEGGDDDDNLHGGGGADRLDGGNGIDWAFYWLSDTGVTVNLEEGTGGGGHAEGDVIVDIENVRGSHYRDVLIGDNGNNILDGYDGNDELRGNDGQDWLSGRAGADRLDGGDGIDWVFYASSDAGVTVNLREGIGEGGHAQGDVIVDVENIQGSGYGDVLIGSNDDNYLNGLDGNDELRGNDGHDWLLGRAGADRLDGGGGADALYGNTNGTSDGSVDVFIFDAGHGDDTIFDFVNNEDQIDLSAFDLSGFDELTISSVSDDVIIDLSAHGGETILLRDFDIADLDATDFLF